jgi:tetratricopeptide (TPR) repeat protein
LLRDGVSAGSASPGSAASPGEKLLHSGWLTLLTLAVYARVHRFDYVLYDDRLYVSENPHTQAGLTLEGVVWAFTTFDASNWHPLTWLSHMLDVELFGTSPGPQHLVNVILHVANALLLFLVLDRATGATGRSAVVAGLFAVHPFRVESVAWIAERKDVLSTLFWMLSMWAYVRYAEARRFGWYALTAATLALGLLAKPMLVTLPFVLLLMDYWPLQRIPPGGGDPRQGRRRAAGLLIEKLPLLGLAALSSLVTLAAQRGTLADLRAFSLEARLANALQSYVVYLLKTVVPIRLRVVYAHPGDDFSPLVAAACLALLVGLTFLLCWKLRRQRYLGVGWLWYLGTLVPVIGVVQVGVQGMADRYTYVPLIGLFIAGVWAAWAALARVSHARAWASGSAAAVLLCSAALSWIQLGHWRDSLTLFSHTVAVEHRSEVAYTLLGYARLNAARPDEALVEFERAIRLRGDYAPAHVGRGMAHLRLGRLREALGAFQSAVVFDPRNAEAYNNIGGLLASRGELRKAIEYFELAEKYRPGYVDARRNRELARRLLRQAQP